MIFYFFVFVFGVKFGLVNLIIIIVIFIMCKCDSFFLVCLCLILMILLGGIFLIFFYSVSGVLLSYFGMLFVKQLGLKWVSIIGISVVGGFLYNVG